MRNSRQLAEYKLSGIYSYAKLLTGVNNPLTRIEFTHTAPSDRKEHERIFGCPVKFSAHRNALVMDSKYLSLPIVEPNHKILKILEEHAEAMLNSLNAADSFARKTIHLLISMMPGSLPNIAEIAKKQAVSVRKLQMKLKEEGTGYQKLLDDVRKNMAVKYMEDRNISVSEISYLIGFSDPRAFHRAFKRWTGSTPETLRFVKFQEHP
jgi:AraC-like DNA-binding protein